MSCGFYCGTFLFKLITAGASAALMFVVKLNLILKKSNKNFFKTKILNCIKKTLKSSNHKKVQRIV